MEGAHNDYQLGCGVAPSSLVNLYETKCGSIFQSNQSSATSSVLSELGLPQISFDPCSWIAELCHVKYSNAGLHEVLSETPLTIGHEPAFPLMAAMFDGQAQIAHLEASNILGSNQYQRANPTLTQTIALDDCGAIGELKSIATAYIGSSEWAGIKKWAYDNFN